MKYLNTKPGSIEELAVNMAKHQNESGYQDMFKKELEKAGKGIGSMTPAEKKAFFNKVDSKYTAKDETTHTMPDGTVMKGAKHKEEEKHKEVVKEEDAYDNDRFIIKNGKATVDNSNTADKKDHVHAPNAKTAVAMYKAGVKSYKDTTDMRKKFPMAVEEVINEIGSFSKIYTKKSMGSHPSKKAEDVFYKGLVQSINVGLRGKPPKRDTFIGIIGRDGSRYYAQGINQLGVEALGLHSNRQDALKAVFDYSVKSKQIQERAVGGEKKTFKEVYKKTKKEAMNTTGDATVDNANQNLEPTEKPENDPDVKVAKKKTDVGSKTTGVDTSPEIAYKN
jgi:hypothetical protein